MSAEEDKGESAKGEEGRKRESPQRGVGDTERQMFKKGEQRRE